mmetsp:Transcript_14260/g.18694  ORF Transcript_14260/g.18694 Transcript_14260/m.18694 type:complete len:281 (+) Transcript_14260:164-1006(+)|eukprot:CAMPEP_0184033892 /NCGR_PEP_ID=MMETSP0955-20130417/4101_1 /TAXON_ID=627963 /ORGANISM="Aplanochytrium sp, Strain PBS07" /LENGTH=280 /DNA_ID=CAMNT_0026320421 /DNA_START=64 /DNA_END=906 /DNA_ORIENTATION=-
MGNCLGKEDDVVSDRSANKSAKKAQKKQGSKGVQQQKIENASRTKTLNLSGSGLKQVPESITRIQELKTLNLKSNSLTFQSFPASFGNLVNLKKLNLASNQLQDLPSSITSLTHLEEIDLSNNLLPALTINLPASLKKINISSNRLVEFPVVFRGMKRITELRLAGNNISGSLPGWVGEIMALKLIDLSDNQVEEIEDGVGDCDNLHSLLLRNNRLTFVPSSVLRSKSLAKMRLEGNKITKAALMKTEGFNEFDKKRTALLNKAVSGGIGDLDTSICGLD